MNQIEKNHVYNIYNEISKDFENTRKNLVWPFLKNFIDNIEPYSIVCDIGSGSGRNLYRTDIEYVASDFSEKMCNILKSKTYNVLTANVLSLPFRDNTFDVVLCVACIHHLSSFKRRKCAINECTRILKPNGKLLITVWAESEKYGRDDQYISWNNSFDRYYHLFTEDEIEKVKPKNSKIYLEKYNYYIINE